MESGDKMDIKILYEDKNIAVCVKPPELVSQSPGMPEKLSELLGGGFFCVRRDGRFVCRL